MSGMTDRDHFAAAALTGLLARRDCYDHEVAVLAWDMADAMLRERERKNHDAAPAATAGTPGTGDTQKPVAWGVAGHKGLLYATAISRMDAVDMQGDYAYHTEIVPLYRHPPCQDSSQKNLTLTDAEREALSWARNAMLVGVAVLPDDQTHNSKQHAATLGALLERTE